MKKTIAFFDFDGTITREDTMLELIKFCKGKSSYYTGMLALSPYLLAMKAGLISNEKAKEKLLSYFFGNTPLESFNQQCAEFIHQALPALIRPDALNKIKEHLSNGDEVSVVSASAENWIAEWCRNTGVKCIATQLEVSTKNTITGKLLGPNCNGQEKVNRIKQSYNIADYDTIYCYGDTSGDKPMLQLATHPFFRLFIQ